MCRDGTTKHHAAGNMRTAAVITMHGTVDFWCYPHFDSPAVFCSLLDRHKGGYWGIHPVLSGPEKEVRDSNVRDKQYYWPETNILVTRCDDVPAFYMYVLMCV